MKLHRFKGTLAASLVSLIIYVCSVVFDLDIFERTISFIERFEAYEADEIAILMFVCMLGLATDLFRIYHNRRKDLYTQTQQVETLKATMVTVQDIVGNALNGLQALRMKAEEIGGFEPDELKDFDLIVQETVKKIRILRSLDKTPIKNVGGNMYGIDIESAMKKTGDR